MAVDVELTGRHYKGAPTGPEAWTCPACGAEVADRAFGHPEGCPACGAGKIGQHVEVPPKGMPRPVVGPEVVRERPGFNTAAEEEYYRAAAPLPLTSAVVVRDGYRAWRTWMAREGIEADTPTMDLLVRAFEAGAMWMEQLTGLIVPSAPPLEPSLGGAMPLGGTVALPRSVAQQILTLLEETADLPDGQQSTELQGWIAVLRETLE